jgi:hypothetical protein
MSKDIYEQTLALAKSSTAISSAPRAISTVVYTPGMQAAEAAIAPYEVARRFGGVFSDTPVSTSKCYTRSQDTMARLFLPFSTSTRATYIKTFLTNSTSTAKGSSEALNKLVQTIAVDGATGSTPNGHGYVDFLLTSANETYQEKVQVVDVLSDNYVAYFFGSAPPVFTYSGVLLNTKQDDWRSAFSILYQHVMRGTQLARRKAVLCLTYDNVVVTGAMLSMNQDLSSDMQMAGRFSFSFLVKRYDVYRDLNSNPSNVAFPAKFTEMFSGGAEGFADRIEYDNTLVPATSIAIETPTRSTNDAVNSVDEDEEPLNMVVDQTLNPLTYGTGQTTMPTNAQERTVYALRNIYPGKRLHEGK